MPGEPPNLFEMADLATPWCIHTVATLGIAHQMAAGAITLEDIARAAQCDPGALAAVLRNLVAKGVFEETEPGRFALNGAARQFLDPGMILGLNLEGIGGRMANIWTTLPKYVRTGRPAYEDLYGRPFWEDLEANPDIADSFDALIGPAGHGMPSADFTISKPWAEVRTVVDVGGGTGAMLASLLKAHPHLHGTLVELPRTIQRATLLLAELGVLDRVTLRPQSFFDALPGGADLYLLRGVINDWADEPAAAILTGCAEAARPGGIVAVMKSIDAEEIPPAPLVIEMLLAGGKRRSLAAFHPLAGRCGLEVIAAARHPSGDYIVECRPSY